MWDEFDLPSTCVRRLPEQTALVEWLSSQRNRTKYVISTERSERFSANGIAGWFKRLYQSLDFQGASSHSGRRGFITQCTRNVSRVGGSIIDVMRLAGHSNLQTTERYISQDAQAQKNLVNIIYQNVRQENLVDSIQIDHLKKIGYLYRNNSYSATLTQLVE